MPDKKTKFKLLLAFAALLHVPSLAHAQLYKWVDAAGRTHYSDNQADVPNGRAKELKLAAAPEPSQGTPDWMRQEEEFKRRLATAKLRAQHSVRSYRPFPQRHSTLGITPENDSFRCNLARDLLSGAMIRTNGAPDVQVAQRDIDRSCK